MRVITPPIKSQGIKTKLVPWIQALVPAVKGRWIEPFLGTGVVAFNSGFREALLGDVNPHLIRFYQAIKNREITPRCVREYLEREGALLEKAGGRERSVRQPTPPPAYEKGGGTHFPGVPNNPGIVPSANISRLVLHP